MQEKAREPPKKDVNGGPGGANEPQRPRQVVTLLAGPTVGRAWKEEPGGLKRPPAPAPSRVALYQREQRSSLSSRSSAARLWAQAPGPADSVAGAGRGSFPERTLGGRLPGIASPSRERLLGEREASGLGQRPRRGRPATDPAQQFPRLGRRDARRAGRARGGARLRKRAAAQRAGPGGAGPRPHASGPRGGAAGPVGGAGACGRGAAARSRLAGKGAGPGNAPSSWRKAPWGHSGGIKAPKREKRVLAFPEQGF